jgi:6-phosphogluconolactonase
MQVVVLADPDALARRVADWMLELALAKDGPFAIALSGGLTPRRLYECLAEPPFRDAFPWARSHWFFGDERFVPPDAPLSNYRMARDTLLSHVPIPPSQIHPVPTQGLTPQGAALAYEGELMTFYGAVRLDAARPLFDVTLLGLGADGHTASLFPDTAALDDRDHWATAVNDARDQARVTLTYPVLESSAHAAFLVEGLAKRAIVARLLAGDGEFPAARLRPTGQLWMFADVAAAPTRRGL